MKEKMRFLLDAVIKHSKIIFPVAVIVAVAVTVALALGVGKLEEKMEEELQEPEIIESSQETTVTLDRVIPEEPLTDMSHGAMYTLMATYYNALANGDVDTIRSISNYVEDTEVIRILELCKYIESYPLIEIYTKPGPIENSYVAYVYTHVTFYGHEERLPGLTAFYVCTDENGNLYLNEGENPDDVLDYIMTISLQVDVVDLNNKVNAEYNEVLISNQKLFDYLSELEKEVSKATGEALALQYAERESQGQSDQNSGEGSNSQTGNETGSNGETFAAGGTVYATATTTVNVRSSDSVQADKLGKIAGGERVQVSEQRANGWTKVVFEGKDGFVKSEYLQLDSTGVAAIKNVKATTNVNLRKQPSETAEKIGVVVGGDSLELLSEANGWSQVRYKGMTGYVKSDYIQ